MEDILFGEAEREEGGDEGGVEREVFVGEDSAGGMDLILKQTRISRQCSG